MDSEAVRRRMNMIVAHFAPTIADDISSPAHLLPLNCSGSLNSVIRRRDNRTYFARQGSASQACFMRIQQQGSSEKGLQSSASSETEWSCNAKLIKDEAPLFSRPTKMKPNLPNVEPTLTPAKYSQSTMSALPKFARPKRRTIGRNGQLQFEKKIYSSESNGIEWSPKRRTIGRNGQLQFEKKIYSSESNGIEWSPKMDVVESGVNYVLKIEIPGVNVSDIRVEIHGQNLKVSGKRSSQCWKMASGSCSGDSILRYHKREIVEGPYEIVWQLPLDGNKDSVSAEFLNGLLQVTVPKM